MSEDDFPALLSLSQSKHSSPGHTSRGWPGTGGPAPPPGAAGAGRPCWGMSQKGISEIEQFGLKSEMKQPLSQSDVGAELTQQCLPHN